jgi:APA family basic amino acid/polyamine antiporter
VFIPALGPENVLVEFGFLKISAAQLYAIASIVFLTFINTKGVKNGKIIQLFFTAAKLIALLVLITAGLYVGLGTSQFSINMFHAWDASTLVKDGDSWISHSVSGMALLLVLGTAMIGSLFSSDAWNNVTFIAGEIKEPHKNIPRSLLLGTGIVTLLYLLANITYLTLLPLHGDPAATDVVGQGIQFAGGSTDRVGTAAASIIFGDTAVYLMAILIMISTFGCNNGIILAGARVYYAMAKEGLFFKGAAKLNQYGVPAYALWVQAFWASILCLSGTYGDLLDYTTFASLLFYIITIGGIFILRIKEPQTERPYKVLAYPFLPILYIIAAATICIILLYTKPQNTWSGLFIVLLGAPFYFLVKSKKN